MTTKEHSVEKTITRNSWANCSLGDHPHVTLETFQNGLTVNLIATDRSAFETCGIDEDLATVVARNRLNCFDFLPVIDKTVGGRRNRIVGLIEIVALDTVPNGNVCTKMQHLSEENLIGADASILTFVRDADRRKCRLIVSGHEISGLVSLSDLHRLPVRAALFGLITYLEIMMANVIRNDCGGTESWLERLSEGRRQKLEIEMDKARQDDSFVDALLFTQFADKVTIIGKSPRLTVGKRNFRDEFEQVQTLRDHLAHANNYAASADAASKICSMVRVIENWNVRFSNWLQAIDQPSREYTG